MSHTRPPLRSRQPERVCCLTSNLGSIRSRPSRQTASTRRNAGRLEPSCNPCDARRLLSILLLDQPHGKPAIHIRKVDRKLVESGKAQATIHGRFRRQGRNRPQVGR